jgi:multidrug efflux pump subunit AcrA (membrane-fusion protein)
LSIYSYFGTKIGLFFFFENENAFSSNIDYILTFVWLAEGNTAKRRFVQTGTLSDEGVTITDGLRTGDKLIVTGYQKVSEGMRICEIY